MKLLIAILNLAMIGWLLLVTPIARVGMGADAGSRIAQLDRAGVINQDKLVEFQKLTQAAFRPENRKSLGGWLIRDKAYTGFLLIPCGLLLAINAIYLVIARFQKEKN